MLTPKKYTLLVLPIFFILAFSCKVKPPQIKGVEGVKIAKAGLSEISVEGDVVIRNPNFFSGKVLSLHVDILDGNDVKLGSFGEQKAFRVKSLRETKIPLRFAVKPANISLTTAAALMSGKVNLQYDVSAKVRYWFKTRTFKMRVNDVELK
jgi:LEA14-like dessication related protein